jgi:hypothetical protein
MQNANEDNATAEGIRESIFDENFTSKKKNVDVLYCSLSVSLILEFDFIKPFSPRKKGNAKHKRLKCADTSGHTMQKKTESTQ